MAGLWTLTADGDAKFSSVAFSESHSKLHLPTLDCRKAPSGSVGGGGHDGAVIDNNNNNSAVRHPTAARAALCTEPQRAADPGHPRQGPGPEGGEGGEGQQPVQPRPAREAAARDVEPQGGQGRGPRQGPAQGGEAGGGGGEGAAALEAEAEAAQPRAGGEAGEGGGGRGEAERGGGRCQGWWVRVWPRRCSASKPM